MTGGMATGDLGEVLQVSGISENFSSPSAVCEGPVGRWRRAKWRRRGKEELVATVVCRFLISI